MFNPETSVSELSGVGKVKAEKLAKLGVFTLRDLVYFLPRAYENRGNVLPLAKFDINTSCSFVLTIASEVRTAKIKKNFSISKFRAFDESGSIEIIFFNAPYIKDVFHIGDMFRFFGKPVYTKSKLQIQNPKYEPYVHGALLPDFVPVYRQTDGLSSKQIDSLIRNVLNDVLPKLTDPLPEKIRLELGLPTLRYALLNAHCPENNEVLSKAMSRLAFDEMLCFGIGIAMLESQKSRGVGVKFSPCRLDPLTDILSYELTASQKNAINDIYRDTVLGENGVISPMSRILVGDVGCGKTICAIAAVYIAAKSKYQSALMVPTEILARQHFEDVSRLLGALNIKTALLLGSTTAKERRRIYEELENGEIDVVIGTHALLSDKLTFCRLGMIITDEQHRFGVAQRAVLKEKAEQAHLLVMSATPIPRTLALALYGDLDVSRITEMPKGRQRVDTYVVDESYRYRLNDFIRKQTSLGGQCYIVCPSIEASEDDDSIVYYDSGEAAVVNAASLDLKNAVEYAEDLKKALPDISIGVLHGKMKPAEKDAVMAKFTSGEISVLVSTTVIEVGVNVPNATLMIVENAERFGLSQLHQLRGRVGRGNKKSFCILVSDVNAEKSKARLEVMRTTYDGFEIAEKDLILRGPGEFFSQNKDNNLRQSGGFEFKFASMCDDTLLFESAFKIAKEIIKADPNLALPEHAALRHEVDKYVLNAHFTIS